MHHSLPPESVIKCSVLCLTPRTNSRHAEAEKNTASRAVEFGVATDKTLIKFRRSNYCLHASMCHPDLPLEALEVCSDWHFWLWTIDDRLDTGDLSTPSSYLVNFLEAAHNITHGKSSSFDDPHLRWLKWITNRLPSNQQFFGDAVDEYLRASTKPGELEATNMEAYLAHRLRDSACKTVFMLVRIYSGNFTPTILETSHILNLEHQINLILSVFNDIVSFDNEQKTDRARWNILNVLQASGRTKNLEESTVEAVRLINEWWLAAKHSQMQLENKACGESLMDLIVGSCFWSINCPRYQK